MPLTPADVSNVEFKKPRMGKRGYDEDEVDDFLDRLEAELARLIEENNELKQKVTAAEQAAEEAGTTSTEEPAEHTESPAAVAVPAEEESEQQRALGMLALAKETADRALAEARAEADRLLTDARERSATMEGDAKEHAEKLERDAREKADQMTAEAEQTKRDILAELGRERASLEQTIASLRSFESDYRARMEDFLQTELQELRERGRLEPTDAPQASGDGELASVGAADEGDHTEQHD